MKPTPDDMKRDAAADLKACDEATPGPWAYNSYSLVSSVPKMREAEAILDAIPEDAPDEAYGNGPEYRVCWVPTIAGDTATDQGSKDAAFIAAARTALPAWIRRGEAGALIGAEVAHSAIGLLKPLDAATGMHKALGGQALLHAPCEDRRNGLRVAVQRGPCLLTGAAFDLEDLSPLMVQTDKNNGGFGCQLTAASVDQIGVHLGKLKLSDHVQPCGKTL